MIQEPQEPVLLVAGGADSATTTRLRAFARIGPAENLRVRSATYSANVLNAAAGSKFNVRHPHPHHRLAVCILAWSHVGANCTTQCSMIVVATHPRTHARSRHRTNSRTYAP